MGKTWLCDDDSNYSLLAGVKTCDDEISANAGHTLHVQRFEGVSLSDVGLCVVIEAGMGASSIQFAPIAARLSRTFAAVIYDRAGIGRSPDARGSRTLDDLVADLVDVIDSQPEEKIILVGHSWGGPITRLAAAQRPDRMGAVVHLDPTSEHFSGYYLAGPSVADNVTGWIARGLGATGALAILVDRFACGVDEPFASLMRSVEGGPRSGRAFAAEVSNFCADMAKYADRLPVLPDIPFTIISGNTRAGVHRLFRAGLVHAHSRTVLAMPQGRHVIIDDTGHFPHITHTEQVAQVIEQTARVALAQQKQRG